MAFIIFLYITLKLFSLSFVPLAPNPGCAIVRELTCVTNIAPDDNSATVESTARSDGRKVKVRKQTFISTIFGLKLEKCAVFGAIVIPFLITMFA